MGILEKMASDSESPSPAFWQRALVWVARAATPLLVSKPWRNGILPAEQDVSPFAELRIPSSKDAGRVITVRLFYPPDAKPDAYGDPLEPLPVYLNIHASGYCLNLYGTDDEVCAYIAQHARCVVVDADHAKAPEHPFPAAYDDILDVSAWIRAQPPTRWDASRLSVGGFSSGGALALALASTPGQAIRSVVGFAPCTNLATWPRADGARGMVKATKGVPDAWTLAQLFELYVPADSPLRYDPRVSPHFARAEAFPPVTLVFGDCDSLYPDLLAFARKLRDAGVDLKKILVEDVGHGWERNCTPGTPLAAERDEIMRTVIARLRSSWQD